MNETLIFEESSRLYICKRASYISGGFRYPEIWEECKAPAGLENTIPRGAAVIEEHNGKMYMLYNTAGKANRKWFVYASEGVRFEHPGKIPEGVKEGLEFIKNRFPDRNLKIGRHYYEKSVSIIATYGQIDVDDFKVKKNDFAEKFSYYEEMKDFFALDLYNKIVFSTSINVGDKNYKKYADKSTDITINDIINDLSGDWKYSGGIGEIIFWQ